LGGCAAAEAYRLSRSTALQGRVGTAGPSGLLQPAGAPRGRRGGAWVSRGRGAPARCHSVSYHRVPFRAWTILMYVDFRHVLG